MAFDERPQSDAVKAGTRKVAGNRPCVVIKCCDCDLLTGQIMMGLKKQIMPHAELASVDASLIEKAAVKRLRLCIGNLAKEQGDNLLQQQKITAAPIYISSSEMQILGARYGEIVRVSAADYAKKLAQAVGIRKRMGKSQRRWVEQRVEEFIGKWTSAELAKMWFAETISSLFTVANGQQSETAFLRGLAVAARDDRLLSDAMEQIRLASALYGRPRRSLRSVERIKEVSIGEKLGDPQNHPTMTVKEVTQAIGMARSSVYRLVDEGPLERASAGKTSEKRSGCRILTRSVNRFLKKSRM